MLGRRGLERREPGPVRRCSPSPHRSRAFECIEANVHPWLGAHPNTPHPCAAHFATW